MNKFVWMGWVVFGALISATAVAQQPPNWRILPIDLPRNPGEVVRFPQWECFNDRDHEAAPLNVEVWFETTGGVEGDYKFRVTAVNPDGSNSVSEVLANNVNQDDASIIYQGASESVTAQLAIDRTRNSLSGLPSTLQLIEVQSKPGMRILPVSTTPKILTCNWAGPLY